jgi:predicted acyltransferase
MIKNRLQSIDVFRGLTIAGMILVNNPGNENHAYSQLKHANWHGFTLTDLVFPSFMFIMGLSMRYSFASFGYTYTAAQGYKILKRAAMLFLVSYLIHLYPFTHWDLAHFRILGVLQRLGLCFALTSFVVLLLPERWFTGINIAILLGYWAIMYIFGDYDPSTNAVLYLDRFLMGSNHLWQGQGFPFDPEGLLSSLPSVATVLIGYQVGMALQKADNKAFFLLKLSALGLLLVLLAWLWHGLFPINKKLWTSSFVLNCAGLDMLLLALVIWLVDLRSYHKYTHFFKVFGLNSIAAYVLAELLAITLYMIPTANGSMYNWLYVRVFQPVFSNAPGSLAFSLSLVLLCWLPIWYMYKRRIFWKL